MRFFVALFSKIVRRQKPDGVRALIPLTVRCERVPVEALCLLAKQLEMFGADVVFDSNRSGVVMSAAGTMSFFHDDYTLTVTIVEDLGHFPRPMVIGGIKQTVYEAVELHNVQRANAEKCNFTLPAEGSANV
jgi:hypothetical protein